MGFIPQEWVEKMGFYRVGKNIQLSDKVSIYNIQNISLGDNCRIDDFAVLSGGSNLFIGRYVHIAVHCSILGRGAVIMKDFSGLSSNVSVFSSSDVYDGTYMTNPTVPDECKKTYTDTVKIGKHSVVGAGSVILPGSCIPHNTAIGALSLVKSGTLLENSVYAGNPLKRIKDRSTDVYKYETLCQ